MQARSIFAVAFLAGIAAAQSAVVVPSSAATKDPAAEHAHPFYGHPTNRSEGRALYMYDTTDIAPVAMQIKSMQVRRSTRNPSATPNATYRVSIAVSISPNAPGAASGSYAANHGTNKATVFSGSLSLPSRNKGTWPEPWEQAIPFAKPFLYVRPAGKSLVIEIVASTTATASWTIEASKRDVGTRTTEASPVVCPHSANRCACALAHHMPHVGAHYWTRYYRLPRNVPSFNASVLVIGLQGAGGRYGGLTLPINIRSQLGVPTSSPGCVLATDIVATVPLKYQPNATATTGRLESPRIPIPNNPWLGNQVFYSQPISLDTHPATKQPMIHSGWANKYRIGTGNGVPATTVFRTGNNARPNGNVRKLEAATIRLNR